MSSITLFKTLLVFSAIVQLFSCTSQQNKPELTNKKVVIEGKINTGGNQHQPVLSYTDFISGDLRQHIAVPDEKGNFRFEFLKYNEQDAELKAGKNIIPLYIIPGKKILLQINDLSSTHPVLFSGFNSKFNTGYYQLKKSLTDFITEYDSAGYYIEKKEPDDYKSYILNFENKLQAFVDDYSEENSVKTDVKEWFKLYIQYYTANHLIYPYNIRFKKYGVADEYWNFFDEYPVSNESALCCSDYYRYCTNYYIYLTSIKNIASDYFHYYGYDWKKFYTSTVEALDSNLSGTGADILIANQLSRFMTDDVSAFDSSKNNLLSHIESEEIRNLTSERFSQLIQALNETNRNIQVFDYRNDSVNTDILAVLQNKHKGKIIYVDNWATWCGPCIREMPHSVNLQKEYSDKAIVFVFICNPDNFKNDRAKSIISEKGITGEHYLMNFRQSENVMQQFKSRRIPRYLIISKSGEIVNNDAPRPGSAQIRAELDRLIN